MKDEQRFEIERAFDLLPHVVGASWTTIWFRMNSIKNPSPEEFRKKTVEYFTLLNPIFDSYPKSEDFAEIVAYIKRRQKEEVDKIIQGKNPEIEKRYNRYIDYG